MNLPGRLFKKSAPHPKVEAQNAIAAHLPNLSPADQQFVVRSMSSAVELLSHLIKTPIPNALASGSFSASQYSRFYKIAFAYYWTMLFIHDSRAKSHFRRLLSNITDQNQADTDRLCDHIEIAFLPNDSDSPQFTLSKVAWSKMRPSLPTNTTSDTLVHITFALVFNNFHENVAPMF